MVSRLPEIPKIMDQATKALEVFISRSDASSSDPTIAKNLEVEKTKLKNEKRVIKLKCGDGQNAQLLKQSEHKNVKTIKT